jgi:hypothetical protein
MARAGDEDEIGYGAAVAFLSDAARRRAERGDPSPEDVVPAPDPDAGIELITSLDAGEDDVEQSADALQRALARRHGAPDAAPVPETLDRESPVDPAGRPREGEQRGVREVLEHHHERRDPRVGATITPLGSADLPPRTPKLSTASESRSPGKALRIARPRRLVSGSLAAVVVIVVLVVIGLEAGSSTATHHRAPAAVTRVSTQHVASPISVIALESRQASAAIGAEGEIIASARAAVEARAKARVAARARARARAAQRARAAAARRRRAAAQRAHAASTAGRAAAGSPQTTATDPVSTTPTSSISPASSSSSSGNDGRSGSSSAPAGPTAIGSAGGSCDPKCS